MEFHSSSTALELGSLPAVLGESSEVSTMPTLAKHFDRMEMQGRLVIAGRFKIARASFCTVGGQSRTFVPVPTYAYRKKLHPVWYNM